MDYTYISISLIPKLMLPLYTKRPAYDKSPYAAAAKLPGAHRHRTPEAILSYTDKGRSSKFLCNSRHPTGT